MQFVVHRHGLQGKLHCIKKRAEILYDKLHCSKVVCNANRIATARDVMQIALQKNMGKIVSCKLHCTTPVCMTNRIAFGVFA